ncbi:malic enzyme5 [Zea mays]|uniref:Malic enzyme5 n=1 Tax=Zea mays TaxID=4577 RepID=A0A1D6M274_MAIZE|nr:malic enzyme5 [Zea mays]
MGGRRSRCADLDFIYFCLFGSDSVGDPGLVRGFVRVMLTADVSRSVNALGLWLSSSTSNLIACCIISASLLD